MIIKIRTRDNLDDLIRIGKSESWVVAEERENQIKKVEIYQFDGKRVLLAEFVKSKSTRTVSGRLIVAFTKGKIENCDYNWVGQNPVKYEHLLTFPEVKIGSQIWMANNLNINCFANGDLITHAKSAEEWIAAAEAKLPAWCYYENDEINGNTYGKLYNWFAVADSRKLNPTGYFIPTEKDFSELIVNLSNAKFKNNIDIFGKFIGGGRYPKGNFAHKNEYGRWWSCEEVDDGRSKSLIFSPSNNNFSIQKNVFKSEGFLVKCIKSK